MATRPGTRPTSRPGRGHRISSGLALVILLWGLVLGGLAGVGLARLAPEEYVATATVLVNPAAGNPFATSRGSANLLDVESEALLVSADPVVEQVVGATGGTATEVLDGLAVEVPGNTRFLRISFRSEDPELAQERADALATAYLDERARRWVTRVETEEGRLARQASRLSERLDVVLRARATARKKARRVVLERRSDVLTEQISLVKTRRTPRDTDLDGPGQVVSTAQAEKTLPDSVDLWGLAGGAAVGLLLAGAVVLVLRTRPAG